MVADKALRKLTPAELRDHLFALTVIDPQILLDQLLETSYRPN